MKILSGLSALALAATVTATVTACFGNSASVFPPGLEPFELNTAPEQTGDPTETLAMVDGKGYSTEEYTFVHGRGYVRASPAVVWAVLKDGDMLSSSCRFDSWTVTENVDPAYEYSYRVANTIEDIITIDWEDEWRFGTIDGSPDDPELAIARSQKVYGSNFIYIAEGSIQLLDTSDPNVTELQFIQHFASFGGSLSDLKNAMQRQFDLVVEVSHDRPFPPCP